MKKLKYIIFSLFISTFILSCGNITIKEYSGLPLVKLTFESIDYNVGYTTIYIFDFESNIATKESYLPGDESNKEINTIAIFTEDEENLLIDKCYSYGLFDIKDKYSSLKDIMDGSGWKFVIDYNNGTKKISSGSNNSPSTIFSNCAKAFYDICKEGVVGYVSSEYYCPPNLSYSVDYTSNNVQYSNGFSSFQSRVNYLWNGFTSSSNDLYLINQTNNPLFDFDKNINYKLVISTENYSNYERFDKFIILSFCFDKELTNENIEYQCGWFKQIEIDINYDKIYLIKLYFKNGDFVEYTFNTKI